MVVVRTGVCDNCNSDRYTIGRTVDGNSTILSTVSALFGVRSLGHIDGTAGSDDLTVNSISVQRQCCVAFACGGVVVVTVDRRISNCNFSTCRSHIHGAKTVESRILNSYNCTGSRSCYVYSVVSSGCDYVIDCYVCSILNNVDRALAGALDYKVLNCHTVCAGNVDCTSCTRCEFLAVTVKSDSLVDYKNIGESNVVKKCDCIVFLCSCESFCKSCVVGIADLCNLAVCGIRLNGVVTVFISFTKDNALCNKCAVSTGLCSLCKCTAGDCAFKSINIVGTDSGTEGTAGNRNSCIITAVINEYGRTVITCRSKATAVDGKIRSIIYTVYPNLTNEVTAVNGHVTAPKTDGTIVGGRNCTTVNGSRA